VAQRYRPPCGTQQRFAAGSGSTSAIGPSSESRRCSINYIAAVDVIALVIEAIQKTLSAVIAAPSDKARRPNAPS
jgi:hypothetical protein